MNATLLHRLRNHYYVTGTNDTDDLIAETIDHIELLEATNAAHLVAINDLSEGELHKFNDWLQKDFHQRYLALNNFCCRKLNRIRELELLMRAWLQETSGDDEAERQLARRLLGLQPGWPHSVTS